jgi:ribosomal protein L11 methyltransferase
MKRPTLWKVSVRAPAGMEDLLAESLSAFLSTPPTIFTDVQTGITTVAVFLEKKPEWSLTARRALSSELKQALPSEQRSGSLRLEVQTIRAEDWAESWKRHFKPMQIGSRLLVKPTWSRLKPRRGQAVVELDPGMSFGTGQHATTGFCLKELTRLRRAGAKQSFLDVGTGSGILAISAVKLGYGPVEAVDLDPDCVRIARANARLNRVQPAIRFGCEDISKKRIAEKGGYAVVCANLMADLLVAQSKRLKGLVQKGGQLVLAGILEKEFAQVEGVYQRLGFTMRRSRVEKEWRSGCFDRLFWD